MNLNEVMTTDASEANPPKSSNQIVMPPNLSSKHLQASPLQPPDKHLLISSSVVSYFPHSQTSMNLALLKDMPYKEPKESRKDTSVCLYIIMHINIITVDSTSIVWIANCIF